MKYLLIALLSAVLILTHKGGTPINNSTVKAKAKTVQAVSPEKVTKVQSKAPTEQQAVVSEQPLTDKQRIMQEAGIAPSDWGAVDYIVSHESSWQSGAINPTSGSCGLVQELPCGKSGCTLGDAVCQLKWASNYAVTRYGSWWGAHSFWIANQWW